MNNRRKLLAVLGASVITAPLVSFAQQKNKIWRVGFLAPRRPVNLNADVYGAFPLGMRELGYVEGKNLVIEWRHADSALDRLPGLAAELVRLKVDVMVTAGTPAASAARDATGTIPIVMGSVSDPVGSGFVQGLAHPGGNVTGLSSFQSDISPKLLELLLRMKSRLSSVAVLLNSTDVSHVAILKNIQAAAPKTGVKVVSVDVRVPAEIETAFSAMAREKIEAVIVSAGGFFNQRERQIAQRMAKSRLPSISSRREYAEAGGLMSYGVNRADIYRRAAAYVDKILKGAKPADIPVEQPTKLELLINSVTAKALGLKIPQSLLVSADKVIE